MKNDNIIKLTQIATILQQINVISIINGNNDAVICSKEALNKLGESIIIIIKDENK